MRKSRRYLAPIIVLLIIAVSGSVAGSDILPEYENFLLKNRLDVTLIEDDCLPLIDFDLVIKSGSGTDTENLSGLAALTTLLLRENTAGYPSDRLAAVIDSVGGSIEVEVYRDYVEIIGNFLARDIDLAIELLAQIVIHPDFNEARLELMKKRIISQIMHNDAIAEQQAYKLLIPHYYGKIGYGLPMLGTRDGLENITLANVRAFYDQHFHPNNAALIIAGDFDTDVLKKKVISLFAQWQPSEKIPTPIANVVNNDSLVILILNDPEASSTEFMIGCPAAPVGADDYAGMLLINYILGGSGEISRLYQSLVVEQNLASNIYSALHWWKQNGLFTVTGTADHDIAPDAIGEALAVIGYLGNIKVPVQELKDAKYFYQGSLNRRFGNTHGTTRAIGRILGTDLGLDYYRHLLKSLDKVNPDNIKMLAQRYLDINDMTVVAIGPENRLKRGLSKFGRVKTIEIHHD